MQLVIDIGNTRVKAGVFKGKELMHFFVYNSMEELLEAQLLTMYPIERAIICSVVNDFETFAEALKQKVPVLVFQSDTPVPIKNKYQSSHTLGSDRLAAAVGAHSLVPAENILVIDAGTCIKYNFVNIHSEYLGGAISPGLQMRLTALHEFTARLPLLERDMDYNEIIGIDSKGSILSGAQMGAVSEVDGFITLYSGHFNNLKVFLTGGDADFFAKRLKNRIFADQFLILKGLNEILDFNKQTVL